MPAGEVPADWRNQRIAVQVEFVPNELLPELRFLDIEALRTRRKLRTDLASLLAYYGYEDLDVPTVRGGGSTYHAVDREVGLRAEGR